MSTATTAVPTGTWNVDPAHSTIGFSVRHMGIATVRGHFASFEGSITIGDALADTTVTGSVDVSSVSTNQSDRDGHLQSADFFDAESHPAITFASTSVEALDATTFKVTGDLTIRGTTKPITLHAEIEGTDVDPWGNDRVGVTATGDLSRGDFGMTFNQALGSGNMLVSDKVRLAIDISAVRAA
jgi:polyisoprenoid-binding protein YceI